MHGHFSSFTPEAMRAFGHELAAGHQRRREFIEGTRREMCAFLADFRRSHQQAEAERRDRAQREADGRRVFVSELRSGIHALRDRFELSRREMTGDLRQMATELRAASEAFRSRPGRQAELSSRPSDHPTARSQPRLAEHELGARSDSDEQGRRPRHGKKRHDGSVGS